jgi:hypothetical protein
MGNSGGERFLPVLEELSRDEDPVVAEHARWALSRLKSKKGPSTGRACFAKQAELARDDKLTQGLGRQS